MRHNHDILPTLHFHDNRLQTDNNVTVRLATLVTVIVPMPSMSASYTSCRYPKPRKTQEGTLLVIIAGTEIFRIFLLDLLVCEAVTDTSVELV